MRRFCCDCGIALRGHTTTSKRCRRCAGIQHRGIRDYRIPIAERLAKRLQPRDNGCIEWTGYVMRSGHGQIQRGRGEGADRVHRVAWELAYGPIPEGAILHHVCGNKTCCNTDHLQLTTRSDHIKIHGVSRWMHRDAA